MRVGNLFDVVLVLIINGSARNGVSVLLLVGELLCTGLFGFISRWRHQVPCIEISIELLPRSSLLHWMFPIALRSILIRLAEGISGVEFDDSRVCEHCVGC